MTEWVVSDKVRYKGVYENNLWVYKGIPFAQPPIDHLRFRAPQKPIVDYQEWDATFFRLASIQESNLMGGVTQSSEDCLYLNVWTPEADNKKRPVMVWVHGGSLLSGSGAMDIYHGHKLAERGDLVFINFNYRLGALGFAHLNMLDEACGADSNNGLRDMIAALEWIKDNVASFGGDPDNITLFGESAGAITISCLLASPLVKGLFHKAIIQSGTGDQVISPEDAADVVEILLNTLGLDKSSVNDIWQLPAKEILQAQKACMKMLVNRGYHEIPVTLYEATLTPVFGDDVLPKPPLEAYAQGIAKGIPLMLGTTAHEWDFFLKLNRPVGFKTGLDKYQNLDDEGLKKLFKRGLPTYYEQAYSVYTQFTDYPETGPGRLAVYSDYEMDRAFWATSLRLAEAQGDYQTPAYHFLFSWDKGMFGAGHTVDLPLVFGLTEGVYGQMLCGNDPIVHTLAKKIQDAWIAFAKSGNPSTAALGEWPAYTRDQRFTMVLGETIEHRNDDRKAIRLFWQGIL